MRALGLAIGAATVIAAQAAAADARFEKSLQLLGPPNGSSSSATTPR